MGCAEGCRAQEENADPAMAEEFCQICPWSMDVSDEISNLVRIDKLLRIGVTISADQLSAWEERALIVIREEIDRANQEALERARQNHGRTDR